MNEAQECTDGTSEKKVWRPPVITVHLLPENKTREMPRAKTAAQLLQALGCPPETALVARNGELLTPDRHIWPNDRITVRKVISMG